MSLFGRIITRAALPGQPVPPLAHPKGMVAALARAPVQQPGEEDTAAPLARAVAPAEDQEQAAPLRRAAEGDGAENLPRLHRAADPKAEDEPQDKMAPLRRVAEPATEEDKAQPLRRASGQPPEEEDKAQPLHRYADDAPAEPEEKAQPLRHSARPLHRYPVLPTLARDAPQAENLTADTSPMPAEASGEPDNPPAMALRRDAFPTAAPPGFANVPTGPAFDPPPAAAPQTETVPAEMRDAPSHLWQAFEPERPATTRPEPEWPAFQPVAERPQPQTAERPRVVIEQIDVAITDSAGAGQGQADFAATLNRALRSRYLGG